MIPHPSIGRRFAKDQRGVAAIETALVGGIIVTALLNVAEIGRYAYLTTQVSAASQAGAQAAAVTCDIPKTPVTLNCPAVNTAVTTAIHGTSLGSDVSLHGDLVEAWYCVNGSGALQNVGAVGSKPANCADAGDASAAPALYLKVETQYAYEPLFPGLTIVQSFDQTVQRSAWMRML